MSWGRGQGGKIFPAPILWQHDLSPSPDKCNNKPQPQTLQKKKSVLKKQQSLELGIPELRE